MQDPSKIRASQPQSVQSARANVSRASGNIFISYRREDAADVAGRIRDWLVQTRRVSKDAVFMDVLNILPGADFMEVIDKTIGQCKAMIVVISPSWLTQVNMPDSFVRQEVEAALRRNLLIIPILTGGIQPPTPDQLPESLRALNRLNARPVRSDSFDYDMSWVAKSLRLRPSSSAATRLVTWLVTLFGLLLVVAIVLSQFPQGNPVYALAHPSAPTAIPTATSSETPAATFTAIPTATPNNPYNYQSATLLLNDPLVDNSQGAQWSLNSGPSSSCAFGFSGLHCTAAPGFGVSSGAQAPNLASLGNVIFEIKVAFAQSHEYGSQFDQKSKYYVLVRDRAADNSAYAAFFTADGDYQLQAVASNAGNVLAQGTISNFQTGTGALNTITLVAQDSTISLYVNFQLVKSVTDSTISNPGRVGVGIGAPYSGSASTDITEVVFSQVRIWQLS